VSPDKSVRINAAGSRAVDLHDDLKEVRMRGLAGAKLLILLAFLWASRPALAAEWTPIGPPGGAVRALAVDPVDPRIVYAGTAGGGVFKSVDGGASWKAANRGLTDYRISALVLDPHAPGTLYVAAGTLPTSSGVFKSTDGGASWVPASQGLPATPPFCGCGALFTVRALAVDRNGVVYAGGVGVSKSVDKAKHWSLATGGLSFGEASVLAVDPNDPRTVYAVTTLGLYTTRDGGLSWNPAAVDARLPEPQALALDPRMPGTLYAGTADGVSKSVDGGAHWQAASRGLDGAAVLSFAVQGGAGAGPAAVFAGTAKGVFKSVDGGGQWTPASSGLQGVAIGALAADPRSPGVLWAGTAFNTREGAGLFKTVSGGGLWRVSNQGLSASHVRSVALDPQDRRVIFAASGSRGVLRTLNGGITWAEANRGLVHRSVQALAFDAASQTLYAGTPDGVFRSTDRGTSWEAETAGLRDPVTDKVAAVEALALDPRDAATLYAAGGSGLYVSHDGAATWSRLAVPQDSGDRAVHGVAVSPASSSRLFAGHATGLFRSTDGGVTWSRPALPAGAVLFSSVAFDRVQPNRVYAAGQAGVVRSADGGASWERTRLEFEPTSALAVDVHGAVYAATLGGVFRSTDHGLDWEHFDKTRVAANGLALYPGRLYAAIDGGGVQWISLAP
jgi:photosystem II stability/assembly factor-like uncharacterized protein